MLGYKIRSKKSSFNNSQNLDQNNEIQEFLKILFKGQFIKKDK